MTWKVVPGASSGQGLRSLNSQAQSKDSVVHGKKLARVLIVDDEPSICKALSMAMSRAGYDVIAAQSGESALAIIRNENVDVMIIDLRIPDMRGDVIFEVAAGHQPHLRYRTLFITGDITDRAIKLIAACNCHFLRKPFDLRDMQDAVAALAPRAQDAAG
jgi:DNA-binding NtrC family response regulator